MKRNAETGSSKSPFQMKHRLLEPIHKLTILAILLGGWSLTAGYASANDEGSLHTVYHVYTNGTYVGIIEDKEKLDQLKEAKIKEVAADFGNLPLTIGTELSIVPEKVFTAGTEEQAVFDKLEDVLTVQSEAVGVQIGGKTAFYVKDKQAYDEVLRQLKLQSVTEAELAAYEARTSSEQPIPALKEDETRISEIVFSSDVQPMDGLADPEDVLSVNKALKLLNKGTLEEKKYTVQSGDVLGSIAVAHNLSTADLLTLNPSLNEDTLLHVGDELNVTVLEPFVTVEVHYEAKQMEPIAFKKVTEEDDTAFKGEDHVKQQGTDGKKMVTRIIRKQNGAVVGSSITEEHVLQEPVDEVTVVGTKVIPSRGTGEFVWPTVGGYVSSQRGYRWGRVHEGIDIARPSSRDILAADNGVVTDVGYHSTYGNRIVITHNNGYETLYAHLSSIDVKVGQTVPQGSKIGVMGSTGRSTGMHLHFEVFKGGSNINPLSVLE
ncbi:peptidase M23 [Sporosarcina sp. NCCP-2222]|uniref:peptidoglycan DD-metalloendopeptidase family protein n=1 Tax=Sporosarcina sp. NCCP-2222 TaxID=2935073 RepID=UPI00207F68AE|nr:M23 family metallopeptidase [Sporosarcina sp. NCCP-2222]GKV57709.1 peptidase M23 [Sporosarcina sp. NCCP-2222]